jgi:hypothetical protein
VTSRQRAWELERATAFIIEGKCTVASGAKSDKADAKSEAFRVECKYRAGRSDQGPFLMVALEWLEEVYAYASRKNQIPMLAIEWEDGVRSVFVPVDGFPEELRNYPCNWDEPTLVFGRSMRTYSQAAGQTRALHFQDIEIPCAHWVQLPWSLLGEYVAAVQPPTRVRLPGAVSYGNVPRKFQGGKGLGSGKRSFGGGGSFGRRKPAAEEEESPCE